MKHRATPAAIAAVLALAATGCASTAPAPKRRAIVARSSAGVAGSPVDRSDVAQTASDVVEAYLRLEVGQGTAADRERVRAGTTAAVAARLLEPARAPLGGFPPRARLAELQVLPVVRAGRWVVQARIKRAGRPAFVELQLISSGRGPQVCLFTSTAGVP